MLRPWARGELIDNEESIFSELDQGNVIAESDRFVCVDFGGDLIMAFNKYTNENVANHYKGDISYVINYMLDREIAGW